MFYTFARQVLKLYYKIFFFYRVEGMENLPKDGGYLICSNHQRFHDPVILAAVIKKHLRFLAKEELFKKGIPDKFLRSVGCVPVERNSSNLSAMRTCINLLKDGNSLILYPEGTRFCKHIADVKPGAVMLASKAKVPIVPVGLSRIKLFGRTVIRFGKPIYYTDLYDKKRITNDEYKMHTDRLMYEIYSLVDEKCCYFDEIEESIKNGN